MVTKVVGTHQGIPYDIYIGRPTIYGNPFIIGRDGTREEVIEKFKQYLYPRLANPVFRGYIELLKDKVLGCPGNCKPRPCHGDVYVELWDNNATTYR